MILRNTAFGLMITLAVSCSESMTRAKIKELNRAIEERARYDNMMEERMDAARAGLATSVKDSLAWEYAYTLFTSYSYVNIDSTGKYLGILRKYSSTEELKNRLGVCEARYLAIRRKRQAMIEKLRELDPHSVSESFRNRYYMEMQRCIAYQGNSGRTARIELYKDALEYPGLDKGQRMRYGAFLKKAYGDLSGALEDFRKCYDENDDFHTKALAANNIAGIYKDRGDIGMFKYWSAEAAINDLKVPVKDYSSLYNLAMVLFEENDLKNASGYMKVVLDDALTSQYSDRIFQSANHYMTIIEALDSRENRLLKTMMILFGILLSLSIAIMALLIHQSRQRRSLSHSNAVISQLNEQLSDANKIKENYLFKYMEMSVHYLSRVNELKHQMRQALKEGGTGALIAMIRIPSDNEGYKEFYRVFDETFLSMYPNFVEQVNRLLDDGLQFKSRSPMSMELRILAAIRLGFTDSGKIAEFLNCAPNSVYTTRSKLKRHAVCAKDEFEMKVKSLE